MLGNILLENLFGIRCIFCKKRIYNGFSCFICDANIKCLNKTIYRSEIDTMMIASRFYNDHWIHEMLLNVKNKPNKNATIWLANEMKYLYYSLKLSDPILYVPGNSFENIHLVEKLILELIKLNVPVLKTNLIKRTLLNDKKQKQLNIFERKLVEKKFKFRKNINTQKVVLLDDIITTGETVKSIVTSLKMQNVTVTNVISIAYTRLKIKIQLAAK